MLALHFRQCIRPSCSVLEIFNSRTHKMCIMKIRTVRHGLLFPAHTHIHTKKSVFLFSFSFLFKRLINILATIVF